VPRVSILVQDAETRAQRALYLPAAKITSKVRRGSLYAYPTQTSIDRFKDGVRRKTRAA